MTVKTIAEWVVYEPEPTITPEPLDLNVYADYAKFWADVYAQGSEPINPMHIVGRSDRMYNARPIVAQVRRTVNLKTDKRRNMQNSKPSRKAVGIWERINSVIGDEQCTLLTKNIQALSQPLCISGLKI